MESATPTPARRELLGFVLLALALRVALAAWSVTVASDGVFSLWAARAGAAGDLRALLRPDFGVHPLYSILIAIPAAAGVGIVPAAYGVSCLASSLAVLPLFSLVRAVGTRRLALWTCFLYALHPMLALAGSEAVNTGLFLGLFILATALFGSALRGWWPGYPLSGLSAGLCYLTRPEGLLLPLFFALAAVHARLTISSDASPSRRARLAGALACALAMGAVSAPYVVWLRGETGRWSLSGRASAGFLVDRLLGRRTPDPSPPPSPEDPAPPPPPVVSAPPAPTTTEPVPSGHRKAVDRGLALQAVKMFVRAFFGLLLPLALLGGLFFRAAGETWRNAAFLLAAAGFSSIPPLLLFFGTRGHYALSHRYFLLPVLFLLPWCAAGMIVLQGAILRGLERAERPGLVPALSAILVGFLAAGLLAKSLGPRRAREAAFPEAGRWVQSASAGPLTVLSTRPNLAWYAGAHLLAPPVPASGEDGAVYAERLARLGRSGKAAYFLLAEDDLRNWPAGALGALEARGFRLLATFPEPATAAPGALESVRIFRCP